MASRSLLGSIARRHYSTIRPHVFPGKRLPHAKYGGRHTVTMLPGDGIGPEMMDHIKRIFSFAHIPVDFETVELSSKDVDETALEFALMACVRNGVAIKGNIETKFDHPDYLSRNVEIRRRLDLYANILHCVSIPTIPTRHKGIDIVLIRENTEGEYSGLEHETIKGVIESIKLVTKKNIDRIARYAFEYAVVNNRKKVTAVHKANIQKLGDGLFLKVAREMAQHDYPQIEFEAMIVDNASMQLDAHRLSDAVYTTLTEQRLHTADIGGSEKTSVLINNIIENLTVPLVQAEAH
uniref:Iso_dh domain-containing protein n=1 Tax=Steinernema glaseri TaxID=37863 RepID=A0A1I7Y5H0_9BILA